MRSENLISVTAFGLLLAAGCSEAFRSGDSAYGADAALVQKVQPSGAGGGADAGKMSVVPAHYDLVDAGRGGKLLAERAYPHSDAGDSGADVRVTGDAAPDAPAHAGCDAATAGPPMVTITTATGASFCIDETEVTVADYAAFLDSAPSTTLLPTECSWKHSFVPDGQWPISGKDDFPISLVDFCDAQAYCAYAGKHLCGSVAGGPNPYADFAKPADEWFYACSGGGKTTLPYGNVFDPSACVGVDFDGTSGFQPASDAPHAVGSATRCHSAVEPFDKLCDLAGNVAEWEDSCDSMGGAADYCHLRGDSYREGNASTMSCGYAPRMTRGTRTGYIGFRCCMEP